MGKAHFPEFILLLISVNESQRTESCHSCQYSKKAKRKRKSGNTNLVSNESWQIKQKSGFYFVLKHIVTF